MCPHWQIKDLVNKKKSNSINRAKLIELLSEFIITIIKFYLNK